MTKHSREDGGYVACFVLVGCGRIAKRHADLLGNRQIEGAELTAVCDLWCRRKPRGSLQPFGLPHYRDMHEMCSREQYGRHCNFDRKRGFTRGTCRLDLAQYRKHIVVEKPMALTLDDADKMIRICDQNAIKLFVVKQNRFQRAGGEAAPSARSGPFRQACFGHGPRTLPVPPARLLRSKTRGAALWALDGGVLSNQASHHVDLLEWMMGDVESVFAKSATALVDIEAEDTAVVVLKFRNGALGIIEATTATRPKDLEGSISVLGEYGSAEIGGFAVNEMKSWNFSPQMPGDESVMADYSVNPPNVYGFGHFAYYKHVVDCINNQKQQLVDGLVEGRKSLQIDFPPFTNRSRPARK